MGWFLSNNTKKKKARRGGASSGGGGWDPRRTLLGLKLAGVIAALVAVAIAWHWGEQELMAHAREHHAKPVMAEDITFTSEPPGIVPDKVNDLRGGIAQRIGDDPTDGAGLRDAAHWLTREHGDLVKHLRQLRRLPDGTIEVDIDFRHPAAIVQMENEINGRLASDGYHVIDAEGYQLYGPVYIDEVDHLGLPLILGVPSANRPTGTANDMLWKGNQVPAAIALIDVLRDNDLLSLVDSISVNNRDDEGRIRLVLTVKVRPAAGSDVVACHIVWGLPPNHPQAVIEPGPDKKVRLLRTLLASDEFKMGYRPMSGVNTGTLWFPQAIRRD